MSSEFSGTLPEFLDLKRFWEDDPGTLPQVPCEWEEGYQLVMGISGMLLPEFLDLALFGFGPFRWQTNSSDLFWPIHSGRHFGEGSMGLRRYGGADPTAHVMASSFGGDLTIMKEAFCFGIPCFRSWNKVKLVQPGWRPAVLLVRSCGLFQSRHADRVEKHVHKMIDLTVPFVLWMGPFKSLSSLVDCKARAWEMSNQPA